MHSQTLVKKQNIKKWLSSKRCYFVEKYVHLLPIFVSFDETQIVLFNGITK